MVAPRADHAGSPGERAAIASRWIMTETTELTDALRAQAFPVLTVDQIARLRPFGTERPTTPGDILFAIGDAHYPLVVVLQGRTEVVDRAGGTERIIKTSG